MTKTLIGFFKGTAKQYRQLGRLAPSFLTIAADTRNGFGTYPSLPERKLEVKHDKGREFVAVTPEMMMELQADQESKWGEQRTNENNDG